MPKKKIKKRNKVYKVQQAIPPDMLGLAIDASHELRNNQKQLIKHDAVNQKNIKAYSTLNQKVNEKILKTSLRNYIAAHPED